MTADCGGAMLSFNAVAVTNDLFVNEKPAGTVLDLFGGWPIDLFVEAKILTPLWSVITRL